jgi:hypothetical protein
MTIQPYDQVNDLFLITDFYPQDLLDQFILTDHLLAPYKKEDWQAEYPRRRLIHEPDSVYQAIDDYTKSQLLKVANAIGLELMACDTGFWLDEAGFYMAPHLDNDGVKVSMQIYLNNNDPKLGTVFYNQDKTVRYRPEYKVNTGYLMINNPHQLHGMGVPVPQGTYRISSYTWFYPKV